MEKIVVLATLIILCQLLLSLYQINYYNRFIRNLTRRYEKQAGYYLQTNVAKNIYSSLVIAVVTNEQNEIVEAYVYSGLTIFSNFKPCKEIEGKYLSRECLKYLSEKENSLKRKAFENLVNKEMKPISF